MFTHIWCRMDDTKTEDIRQMRIWFYHIFYTVSSWNNGTRIMVQAWVQVVGDEGSRESVKYLKKG